MAIVDFVNRENRSGILKCILGVTVWTLGWLLVDIALYLIAGILVLHGLSQIVFAVRLLP